MADDLLEQAALQATRAARAFRLLGRRELRDPEHALAEAAEALAEAGRLGAEAWESGKW